MSAQQDSHEAEKTPPPAVEETPQPSDLLVDSSAQEKAGKEQTPISPKRQRVKTVLKWTVICGIGLFLLNSSNFLNNLLSAYKTYLDIGYSIITATAGSIAQTAATQETATAKAEATAHAPATQGSIQATDTQAAVIAEDQVDLTAYYFCSRILDVEEPSVKEIINQKLSGLGLIFGKLMITPYWNQLYRTTNREYLFVILANRGTVLLKPGDVTDVLWQPNEYEPIGWIDRDTTRTNGNIEPGIANALLVADRMADFSIPTGPTSPVGSPENPLQFDPSTASTAIASSSLFRCQYPGNWRVTMIEFTVNYTSEGSKVPRSKIVNISEDSDSTKELFDPLTQ